MIKDIQIFYSKLFGQEPELCSSSPGRINLIGEHTDYNNGYVLPASIDKKIYAAFGKRMDDNISMYSVDFDEIAVIEMEHIIPSANGGWKNYILGVIDQLNKRNYRLTGFNIVVGGDIPIGAGLSSSAAIECAVIYGLNELFQLGIEKMEMVKIAQKAEHEYAGVRCGIMDQFTSMFGKKNYVIRLDCQSLEYDYKPFMMDGYKLVLFDTNVKHSLAGSEYNVRRQQCEAGVAIIQQYFPAVNSLRDVTLEMLDEYVVHRDTTIYNRCKYVVQENSRLLEACNDLAKNDLFAFGKKMYETHEGLSKLYEVSCAELDSLVLSVRNNSSVLGARMMGGGFGGCTINMIIESSIDEVIQAASSKYEKSFNRSMGVYIVNIEDGANILN